MHFIFLLSVSLLKKSSIITESFQTATYHDELKKKKKPEGKAPSLCKAKHNSSLLNVS